MAIRARPASLFASALALSLLAAGDAARPVAGSGRPTVRGDGDDAVNVRPIVGILTQPGPPAPEGSSYIAASYVKWVEAAGARVVPIFYDETPDEIRSKFAAINALLLPGGGAKLRPGHPFYDTAAQLVRLAIKANDGGDYFPVHGTCLGMETLSIIVSQNYTLLSDMDAEDAPAPLMYTDQAEDSHLFRSLPPGVVRNLQNTPIAFENHMHGVVMPAYEENPRLRDFFKVLALSLDKAGLPYISAMEARQYPITATQFHPEKNQFEWNTRLHIPHSPEAVEMGQEMANFLVREARRNGHAARDALEEDAMLIYNYAPSFTGRHEAAGGEEEDFEQTYVFSGPGLALKVGRRGQPQPPPRPERPSRRAPPGVARRAPLGSWRW